MGRALLPREGLRWARTQFRAASATTRLKPAVPRVLYLVSWSRLPVPPSSSKPAMSARVAYARAAEAAFANNTNGRSQVSAGRTTAGPCPPNDVFPVDSGYADPLIVG